MPTLGPTPPRRISTALKRYQARQDATTDAPVSVHPDVHDQTQGRRITVETIEQVNQNGSYVVLGVTLSAMGTTHFAAGDSVYVLWDEGTVPSLILAHAVRRAQFVGSLFNLTGGVIEELMFLPFENATVLNRNKPDLWFRNRDVLVPLKVNKQIRLPSFDEDEIEAVVVWGLGGDRFVIYFTVEGDQNATLFVFKMKPPKKSNKVVLGTPPLSARLEQTIKIDTLPGTVGSVAVSFPPITINVPVGGSSLLLFYADENDDEFEFTFSVPPVPPLPLSLNGMLTDFELRGTFSNNFASLELAWVTGGIVETDTVKNLGVVSGGMAPALTVFPFPDRPILDDQGDVFLNYRISVTGERAYEVVATAEDGFQEQRRALWSEAGRAGSAFVNVTKGEIILPPTLTQMTFADPTTGNTVPIADVTTAFLVPASAAERASGVTPTARIRDIQTGVATSTLISGNRSVSWGTSVSRNGTAITTKGSAVIYTRVATTAFEGFINPLGFNLHRVVQVNPNTSVVTMFDLEHVIQKNIFTTFFGWNANRLTVLRPDLLYASSEGSKFSVLAFDRITGEIFLDSTFPTFPLGTRVEEIAARRKWQDVVLRKVDGLKNLPPVIRAFVASVPSFITPPVSIQLVNDQSVLSPLHRFQKN